MNLGYLNLRMVEKFVEQERDQHYDDEKNNILRVLSQLLERGPHHEALKLFRLSLNIKTRIITRYSSSSFLIS
jgi:hypothetical protein